MTCILHQEEVVMSSQITPTQSSNTHPLAHMPGTCDFAHTLRIIAVKEYNCGIILTIETLLHNFLNNANKKHRFSSSSLVEYQIAAVWRGAQLSSHVQAHFTSPTALIRKA